MNEASGRSATLSGSRFAVTTHLRRPGCRPSAPVGAERAPAVLATIRTVRAAPRPPAGGRGGGGASAPRERGRAFFGEGALALPVVLRGETGLDHRLDPGRVAPAGGPSRLADRRLGRGDGERRVPGDAPGQAHDLIP